MVKIRAATLDNVHVPTKTHECLAVAAIAVALLFHLFYSTCSPSALEAFAGGRFGVLSPSQQSISTSMSKSPSLRRIQADIRELALDPSDRYHAAPLENDMFEW